VLVEIATQEGSRRGWTLSYKRLFLAECVPGKNMPNLSRGIGRGETLAGQESEQRMKKHKEKQRRLEAVDHRHRELHPSLLKRGTG
jgi:hypothetical protein